MTVGKVRRIDFYPDEYVAGVAAKLSAVDQGVYWMVCALVYSRGGPIDDDHTWLAGLFKETHWRSIRGSLDRLIASGKVERVTEGAGRSQITVRRCARELQKALTRTAEASQNGRTGGRPPKKNKEIEKPEAFRDKKLTTNQQPPTNNPSVSEEETSDIRTKTRKRASYPQAFEDFWKAYPTDRLMSKKEAAAVWSKLTPEDQQLATKAVPEFVGYCAANPTYRPVHACRFLGQRRFDGFTGTGAVSGPQGRAAAPPRDQLELERILRE
jgi:uncharacterized protein YdaU (DUF1376 family)